MKKLFILPPFPITAQLCVRCVFKGVLEGYIEGARIMGVDDDAAAASGQEVDAASDAAPLPEPPDTANPGLSIEPSNPLFDNRNINQDIDGPERYSSERPVVRVPTAPVRPSAKDVEEHNACGHLPFRAWCPVCVFGWGKEAPHKRIEEYSDMPLFICDYCFLTPATPTVPNNAVDK